MALAGTGFQRRGGKEGLTPQGDQMGHTAADGMAYRDFLAKQGFDTRPLPEHSRAFEVVEGFLDRMRAKGVVVVGGLPTTPDHAKLNDADFTGAGSSLGGGKVVYIGSGSSFTLTYTSVPEPATWSLMIIGFGLVGLGARRRTLAIG
jgi:hypothetical protein